ncbi:MAG TPA: patatin-like phospholipase family protein [Galbitalea sp.]
MTQIVMDPSQRFGFRRPPDLEAKFRAAAAKLLETDGWIDPAVKTGSKQLVADLALEGGGVKGIGLVGAILALSDAGYTFRGVAGTSAGAIAASLVAALSLPGNDVARLKPIMDGLVFQKFMPNGKIHQFLDDHFGPLADRLVDGSILVQRPGIYNGNYLTEWLGPVLAGLGVDKFSDLKILASGDPGMSLPTGHEYSLVVHTSDITRELLVHLPWEYGNYGRVADEMRVVDAVRASMSIPFFFDPVAFPAEPADVALPLPDGSSVQRHYGGGTVTWVDGGMLNNFPIHAFDRVDGKPPRWPTIGVKLSALQTSFPPDRKCENSLSIASKSLHTMLNEGDSYGVDPATAGRTIFVDNAGIGTTDFDINQEGQDTLFLNGVSAATDFLILMADFNDGSVPRTSNDGKSLVDRRRMAV